MEDPYAPLRTLFCVAAEKYKKLSDLIRKEFEKFDLMVGKDLRLYILVESNGKNRSLQPYLLLEELRGVQKKSIEHHLAKCSDETLNFIHERIYTEIFYEEQVRLRLAAAI